MKEQELECVILDIIFNSLSSIFLLPSYLYCTILLMLEGKSSCRGGGREIKFLEGSGLMKSTSYVLIAVLELFFSCFSGFDLREEI